MSVARILARKGNEVFTANPNETLQDVAAHLARRGIGALVVVDRAGEVLGLISEPDVVAAVARRGADALEDAVASHMVRNFRFVTEDDSIADTMETMTVERCRHLPVMRDGALAGIVSIGDVVKYRIDMIEAERLALREYIATA
jgi:CBS domain-containing protein